MASGSKKVARNKSASKTMRRSFSVANGQLKRDGTYIILALSSDPAEAAKRIMQLLSEPYGSTWMQDLAKNLATQIRRSLRSEVWSEREIFLSQFLFSAVMDGTPIGSLQKRFRQTGGLSTPPD